MEKFVQLCKLVSIMNQQALQSHVTLLGKRRCHRTRQYKHVAYKIVHKLAVLLIAILKLLMCLSKIVQYQDHQNTCPVQLSIS